jgi:hypothetical protein
MMLQNNSVEVDQSRVLRKPLLIGSIASSAARLPAAGLLL